MGEMLPQETKQSGGKIFHHSNIREGVFIEEAPRNRQVAGACEYGNEI